MDACGSPSSNDAQRRRYSYQAFHTERSPPKNNWTLPGPSLRMEMQSASGVWSYGVSPRHWTIHAEEYARIRLTDSS